MKKLLSGILVCLILTANVPVRADLIDDNVNRMKSMLMQPDFQVFAEDASENALYYGAKLEPRSGVYFGACAGNIESTTRGLNATYSWFEDGHAPTPHGSGGLVFNWNFAHKSIEPSDYAENIKNTIDGLANSGQDVFLVFGKEMNIDGNFSNPEDFKRVFRFISDYARDKPNIAMVWAPNDVSSLDITLEMFYPGDEYVDWIGMSLYTIPYFQGVRDHGRLTESNNIAFVTGDYANAVMRAKPIMDFMARNNINKPVMLTESGVGYKSTLDGEDFTEWASMQQRRQYGELYRAFPQIKLIMFFNTTVAGVDKYHYNLDANEQLYNITAQLMKDPIVIEEYGGGSPISYTHMSAREFDGEIRLSAYAYEPKSEYLNVKYIVDGSLMYETVYPPYSFTLTQDDISAGQHTLTVQKYSGNTKLAEKTYNFVLNERAKQAPAYIYDEQDAGAGVVLPFDILAGINNAETAAEALDKFIKSLSPEERQSAAGIDRIILFAEALLSQSTAIPAEGNDITVDRELIDGTQADSIRRALEGVLAANNIAQTRAIRTIIKLISDADSSAAIIIDKSCSETGVDAVFVQTGFMNLSFNMNHTDTISMDIERLDSGRVSVTFADEPKNPVTIGLPGIGGNGGYWAVAGLTGGKYNPATNALEANISANGVFEAVTNEMDFADIKDKPREMQEAINQLASKGIINGTGDAQFSPDSTITRAEIAALIVRMMGKLDPNEDGGFSDVTRESWYFGTAGSSKKHGIINGFEDGTFRGEMNIPKSQMYALIGRILKNEMGYIAPADADRYLTFTDNASIPGWAQHDIAISCMAGLVQKRADGMFDSDEEMTRGNAAIAIKRLFDRLW